MEEFSFNLTPEEEAYLLQELSDFFRGYIFFTTEKMGQRVIDLIKRGQVLHKGDEITVNYSLSIGPELIIGMLGKRLPYPDSFTKGQLSQGGDAKFFIEMKGEKR